MRKTGYWLFGLVAWPALAWGAIELTLRIATGYHEGLANAVLVTAAAGATIALSRWRVAGIARKTASSSSI